MARRNRLELLEDRVLLAGDFLRFDGTQYTLASALAAIHSGTSDNISEYDEAPSDSGDDLAHIDATANAYYGDTFAAIASSHADTTALALTPLNTRTIVPSVSAAGTVQDHAAGGEDSEEGDLYAEAVNASIPWTNAQANGEYRFEQDDSLQYVLHASIFIGAYGGSNATGSGIASSSVNVHAAIRSGFTTIATVNGSGSPETGWTVNGSILGVDIGQTGLTTLNKHYHFLVPIADDSEWIFSATGEAVGAAYSVGGVGHSATVMAHFASGAWGYVTPANSPPGDIDGDGDVDSEDQDLWISANPATDSNQDGVVNGSDFIEWVEAAGAIVVTTEADESGQNPDDTSLREAIAVAANNPGKDTIVFAPGVEAILLENGQLSIGNGNDVSIFNSVGETITIDADDTNRAFSIASGAIVNMSGLTITGGYSSASSGGAAIHNAGELSLDAMVFTGNHATNHGGAIYVAYGELHVSHSTFHDNTAGTSGGAILVLSNHTNALVVESSTFYDNHSNDGGAIRIHGSSGNGGVGTATIVNSTFSANTSTQHGGAIRMTNSAPALTITNSTITLNEAANQGGGIHVGGGIVKLFNTIVAGNLAAAANDRDLYGSVNSSSNCNLFGANETSQPGTKINTSDPGLAGLGQYGGPTLTHALLSTSPAHDQGDDDVLTTYSITKDQRGRERKIDLPGVGSTDIVDIGAFEAGNVNTLVVTIIGDEDDNDLSVSDISLREALELSASIPGEDAIVFADSLFTGGPATITLSHSLGQLSVTSDVSIEGPGADVLTLDANGDNDTAPQRAILTNSGTDVTIRGLTITGGDLLNKGGGIYSLGDLTLDGVRVIDNEANYGAGIYHENGALTLINSEVEGNYAYYDVGGLYFDSSELLTVTSSTIYNNAVEDVGTAGGILIADGTAEFRNATISWNGDDETKAGGIVVDGDADLLMVNSTVAFNAGSGSTGGIYVASTATTTLHNTIVAKNTDSGSQDDLFGDFESGSSYNLIGFDSDTGNGIDDGDAYNNTVGETSAIDPKLRLLIGYHGGPTKTHVLLDDSPAIDAGDNAIALMYLDDEDQRGENRIVGWDGSGGDVVDIGAVELAFGELYSSLPSPPPI